jgi:hypothetical protein
MFRNAVPREAEQETLQCMSDELDELIAMFAETHTQTAELRRVLERTCRRAEAALAIARERDQALAPLSRCKVGGQYGSRCIVMGAAAALFSASLRWPAREHQGA